MLNKVIEFLYSKIHDNDYRLIKDFLEPYYQQINIARLQHLESLNLDLKNKSVIEFGAGIGDHTLYYLNKNCTVLPTDGRKELVDYISKRFDIEVMKIDIEKDIDEIKKLPRFDIVHCYGVLYHISNPREFLEAIQDLGKLLLLETCVSKLHGNKIEFIGEDSQGPTQSVNGKACRPTREWVFNTLRKYFNYVYLPYTQPRHKEFPTFWRNIKNYPSNNIRAIFIASHTQLNYSLLTKTLIQNYKPW